MTDGATYIVAAYGSAVLIVGGYAAVLIRRLAGKKAAPDERSES
jgi:hypothetical protein